MVDMLHLCRASCLFHHPQFATFKPDKYIFLAWYSVKIEPVNLCKQNPQTCVDRICKPV